MAHNIIIPHIIFDFLHQLNTSNSFQQLMKQAISLKKDKDSKEELFKKFSDLMKNATIDKLKEILDIMI